MALRAATPSNQPPTQITASVKLDPLYPPIRPSRPRKTKSRSTQLTALPIYKHLIWVIDDFLSPQECAAWISHSHTLGFERARLRATRDTAFRDSCRAELWSEEVAARIWRRLAPFIPETLGGPGASGCHPKIRLYCYQPGQRFGKHVDESVELEDGRVTVITVLVYLNDDELEGGETVFYDGRRDERVALSFKPKRGSLLFHGYVRRGACIY